MPKEKSAKRVTRRELVKKVAYVTPVILTLTVNPSHAKTGSGGDSGSDYSGDDNSNYSGDDNSN